MCGRYYIAEEDMEEQLREVIEILNRREQPQGFKRFGEIYPNDVAPVIANNRSLKKSAFAMKWGYILGDGKLVINARSETAAQRPLFRDSLERRRCVLPASWYYEWEHTGGVRGDKFTIKPKTEGMTYLAGLYRLRESLPEFTILTRACSEDIAFIHERMPVLLPGEMIDDWLDPKHRAEELMACALTQVDYKKV